MALQRVGYRVAGRGLAALHQVGHATRRRQHLINRMVRAASRGIQVLGQRISQIALVCLGAVAHFGIQARHVALAVVYIDVGEHAQQEG